MAQIYKITNTINNKSYIGITVAHGKSYLDRFAEHLVGKGSVWIKRELDSRVYKESDFIIEMLEENTDIRYIADREIELIREYGTLYPNGYNGNIGNYIIRTPESHRASGLKRRGTPNPAAGFKKGYAVFKLDDGTQCILPTDHKLVTDGNAKHLNYKHGGISEENRQTIRAEKLRNNGVSDKQLHDRQLRSILWKTVHENEWWKMGRVTMRDRMSRGEFTDKELDLYFNRRSDIVKESWSLLSYDQRLERTRSGLDAMNSKMTCEYCGTVTNKGNYNRWHGENCKKHQ